MCYIYPEVLSGNSCYGMHWSFSRIVPKDVCWNLNIQSIIANNINLYAEVSSYAVVIFIAIK